MFGLKFWKDELLLLLRTSRAFKFYFILLFISLLYQAISPSFLVDSHEYLQSAENLFSKGSFSTCLSSSNCDHFLPETRRTPAYPFLIAVFHSTYILLAVQLLIGLFVPVVAHRILLKIQGSALNSYQSRHFIWFILFYPLQFFYTSLLMPEIFCQLLVLLIFWNGLNGRYYFLSLNLTLLILFKPVFILLMPLPFILLFYRFKFNKLGLLLPVLVFVLISGVHHNKYGIFHYSSVAVENKFEFNAMKLLPEATSKNEVVFHDSMLKNMNFANRYNYMDSVGSSIILNSASTYIFNHIKGTLMACIDPGRYDIMAYLKIKNTSGFMQINGSNGWLDVLRNQPILILIYIFIFLTVNIYRMILFVFSIKKHFKSLYLVYIFVAVLIAVTGPVGSARYLFPIMPVLSIFALLTLNKVEKNISIK